MGERTMSCKLHSSDAASEVGLIKTRNSKSGKEKESFAVNTPLIMKDPALNILQSELGPIALEGMFALLP